MYVDGSTTARGAWTVRRTVYGAIGGTLTLQKKPNKKKAQHIAVLS
jgi:hypothetical protein